MNLMVLDTFNQSSNIRLKETNLKNTRPKHIEDFVVPFKDTIIRPWKKRDRTACAELIGSVLKEYGLEWDPINADQDVIDVENAYKKGEFWVVEHSFSSTILGTAAFYEVPHRGVGVIEIRKMYLKKAMRGTGLGSFLLLALEHRAVELGYSKAVIETASVLKEACSMYTAKGFIPSVGIETSRCDLVLEKTLQYAQPISNREYVEAVDSTKGWRIACVPRAYSFKYRILYRAVVVLVKSSENILVHRRSMKKDTFPGRMSVFITGCVNWTEDPVTAARREVFEEVGLSHLEFLQPFAPFIPTGPDGLQQRIRFHPFVARGYFSEEDVVCDTNEVEMAKFMTREDIIEQNIGGSLWQEYCFNGV